MVIAATAPDLPAGFGLFRSNAIRPRVRRAREALEKSLGGRRKAIGNGQTTGPAVLAVIPTGGLACAPHGQPATDVEHLAGDERCAVIQEERDGMCDVRGRSKPAYRDAFDDGLGARTLGRIDPVK